MSTQLTASQRAYYESKFNRGPWSNTFEYGGGNTRDDKEYIKSCKKVQSPKKTFSNIIPNYRDGKGSILPYQAKYLLKYGIPNGIISHRCDDPKNRKKTCCTEETHMTDSDANDDNQRQKCHNKIIDYAKPK